MKQPPADSPVQTVQIFRHDFDRALASHFAPVRKRAGLQALLQLDFELEKINWQVHDPALRHIRLKFWHDALASADGGGPPLALELRQNMGAGAPLISLMQKLVEIHGTYDEKLGDIAHQLQTDGQRQQQLFRVALAHLEAEKTLLSDECLDDCGLAYARALFLCRSNGQDLVDKQRARAIGKEASSAFRRHVAQLAQLPASARSALLPLALVSPYLDLFQRSDKNLKQALDLHRAQKAWKLWQAARSGFQVGKGMK